MMDDMIVSFYKNDLQQFAWKWLSKSIRKNILH